MKRGIFILLVAFWTGPISRGQAPEAIAYQAMLVDAQGNPINGKRDLTIKLYSVGGMGGPLLRWARSYDNVSVDRGVVSVVLSGGEPELGYVSFDQRLYVEVTVAHEDGSNAQILSPMTALTSVPYALSLRGMRVIAYPYEYLGAEPGAVNMIGGCDGNYVEGSTTVGATIAGGGSFETEEQNVVGGAYGAIGGGYGNRAHAGAAVAGGAFNSGMGSSSFVGGGYGNVARGEGGSVGGGTGNRASGEYATVPGGQDNQARGSHSLAAGYKARAKNLGTFVWNDRSVTSGNDSLVSTADNQFLIRAKGGMGINTNTPPAALSIGTDGSKWNLSTTEGDFRIGGPNHRLKIGIALEGGGAGDAFIGSQGGTSRIILQSGATRVAVAAAEGFYPWPDGQMVLGTASYRWKTIYATNGVIQTSDARQKTHVANLDYGLAEVLALRPVSFTWRNDEANSTRLGLIAQEVASVMPELVEGTEDSGLGLNYAEIIPLLVKAIQELKAEVDELKVDARCEVRSAK